MKNGTTCISKKGYRCKWKALMLHGQQFIKWTKYWVYRKAYVLHTAQVITICDKFVVCLFDGV